ncbi:uncharacterized protein LOC127285160 isoform X1 [Leptopilina boulardi]|uniref:uncharacterized protein LOC127285160 isoform X1 n=1 Tax=Leptopilina boulardi TaxID=63433 RepID=UPI0021F66AA2|nr:uncharacterized protein LOC127285160 isoform X1 [Leptopilina boulardi]XP_051166983.1 uncharacterized protein LOC127285160 isoform X1 [Leptopilina boulardi]XP_051166993.1 uncharacterized protein LOC127285160 isoform X1 [Leptopilina boulardi]
MSRHILSRPRTRVYGCNYDKGESYYKPMVDHLDRKYSGRPLFSEPRNSLADEIAARRSDIGTRDLAGSRQSTSGREFEPEFEPRSRTIPTISNDPFFDDGDETVFDIRGQRTSRTRRLPLSEDFANEVASTTRKLKSRVAAFNLDATEALDAEIGLKSRSEKLFHDTAKSAKSALEDAESAFRRRPKFRTDEPDIPEERPTRWSKLLDSSENLEDFTSAAAGRAKLTKARLNDLETEMEEMAERQAKRERRAAALRALVNENSMADDSLLASSNISSKTSMRSERAEKHVSF